ncbi:MAG: PQQ-binding-like beta-propeller repeat protein [Halanaeroarchaeum sp.]
MPPLDRRALLRSLGDGSVALLGGCASTDPGGPTTATTATTPPPTDTTTAPTDTTRPPDDGAVTLGGGTAPLPTLVWPQSRRGPANGAYVGDGPALEEPPTATWSVEPTGVPDADRYTPVFSAPVADDARVYVANRLRYGTMVSAPDRQFVRAFDRSSGEQVWEHAIGSRSEPAPRDLPTTPAVAGEAVLVGMGRTVRAIAAERGDTRWTRSLAEDVHAVVPTADRSYVRAHRSVVALDGEGAVDWETPLEGFPASLAVGEALAYVSVSRRVYALDRDTGEVRWTTPLPAVEGGYGVDRLVAVAGGVLAVQNTGDCYGIRADGDRVWHAAAGRRGVASDGTTAYVSEGDALVALDVASGGRRWRRACDDLEECGPEVEFGAPILVAGTLLVPFGTVEVGAFEPGDGSLRWRLEAPTRFVSLAATDDALLGVGDESSPLVAMAVE